MSLIKMFKSVICKSSQMQACIVLYSFYELNIFMVNIKIVMDIKRMTAKMFVASVESIFVRFDKY